MSHGKQFTLYTHKGGPNGWKINLFLEELGLTYHAILTDWSKGEHKSSPHIDLNPNGRIPTIIDHWNGDFVLWESDAILIYLADKYDTERKFSASKPEDKYKELQWLFFQASGQGPYFGQAVWFSSAHSEKIPSAIERYQNEVKRVLGVLERALSKQEWLVGDKYSIADLSFIMWHTYVPSLVPDFDVAKETPHVYAWMKNMTDRPVVKKVIAEREVAWKS